MISKQKKYLLCLDMGNSTLCAGLWELEFKRGNFLQPSQLSEECVEKRPATLQTYHCHGMAMKSDEEVLAELQKFLEDDASKNPRVERKITACIAASVVSSRDTFFSLVEKKLICCPVILVGREFAQKNFGFRNIYVNPNQLGSDRIANIMAGMFYHPSKNVIIADFGSVTSFQMIHQPENDFVGGCLAPGLDTTLDALLQKGSLLPNQLCLSGIMQSEMKNFPAMKDTKSAIQSGFFYAIRGMIREILQEMQQFRQFQVQSQDQALQPRRDYVTIATGGRCNWIAKQFPELFTIIDPFLTMRGLRVIFEQLLAAGKIQLIVP